MLLGGLVGAVLGLVGGCVHLWFGAPIPSTMPADEAMWESVKAVFVVIPAAVVAGGLLGTAVGFVAGRRRSGVE